MAQRRPNRFKNEMKRFRIETKIPVASQITSSSFGAVADEVEVDHEQRGGDDDHEEAEQRVPRGAEQEEQQADHEQAEHDEAQGPQPAAQVLDVARPHAPMASVVSAVAPAAWITASGSALA